MSKTKVRINGRGNAWPVILGQDHPFYNKNNIEDLANASCSIIQSNDKDYKSESIEWELMIDAGHGSVQYLLKNHNRIPNAVFLTHSHIDHTLGLDWIVQSYYKTFNKRYPVYATSLCWIKTLLSFPHLEQFVDFKEILPYKELIIEEAQNVICIAYPVYHGQNAEGAVMYYFKVDNEKSNDRILITGDLLCPFLREQDYEALQNVDLLITDANNRFPYPKSNHWSIVKGEFNAESHRLKEFKEEIHLGNLLYPHIKYNITDNYSRCFDYFLNKKNTISEFIFSLDEFIYKINPLQVAILHYSGSEDEKYYKMSRLSECELFEWLANTTKELDLNTKFIVSYVGQHIEMLNSNKTNR